jgi:uncharacterized protein (DUF433 family)/transposase-like protein
MSKRRASRPVAVHKRSDRTPSLRSDDPRLALPLCTLREAARNLDVPPSVLRSWVRERAGTKLTLTLASSCGRGRPTMPFVGLVEAYVLTVLRRVGLRTSQLQSATKALAESIGVNHPLAAQRMVQVGAEALADLRSNREHGWDVVRAGLQRITYGSDGWASRLRLVAYEPAEVVVDPGRAFGCPLVVNGGARVEDLVHRFCAGDSIADVADDFGVRTSDVEAVIRVATRHVA